MSVYMFVHIFKTRQADSTVDEILNNNQKFSEKNSEEKLTLTHIKSYYTIVIKTISYQQIYMCVYLYICITNQWHRRKYQIHIIHSRIYYTTKDFKAMGGVGTL